jgi:hypothetical protein
MPFDGDARWNVNFTRGRTVQALCQTREEAAEGEEHQRTYAVVRVHWEPSGETPGQAFTSIPAEGVHANVEPCDSLGAAADAVIELTEPERWVSIIGITGTGMRPLGEAEQVEVVRLLGERGCDVEDARRSGNAFMVRVS